MDLSGFLNRRLQGVHVNEIHGNPFQADLNYRGYTAPPLPGTPQGLSVYMDCARINQPFGGVVSWDPIPPFVIADLTLMPGSNPFFGLNTLGGALSVCYLRRESATEDGAWIGTFTPLNAALHCSIAKNRTRPARGMRRP